MITIRNIDHVVLRVADLERSMRFYCQVLGCELDRRRKKLGMVHLRAGASMLDLVDVKGKIGKRYGPAAGDQGRNVDHLAFRVEAFDEAQMRAHLEAHGVEPGEVKTLYGNEGDGPAMYIEDPDGNTVELKGPAGKG